MPVMVGAGGGTSHIAFELLASSHEVSSLNGDGVVNDAARIS